MTIDETIEKERKATDRYKQSYKDESNYDYCNKMAEEHEQLAEWLEEYKALRLLLEWSQECDFGLDSFPEEYKRYKDKLTEGMSYTDMMITIAKCCVKEMESERNL